MTESAQTDAAEPSRYVYDPADPTPAFGGARLLPGAPIGSVDNTKLEARADVLTFTGPVLENDTELIGDATATIWFESSRPFADLFVRICDVDDEGVSRNVTDGFAGLTDADTLQEVILELSPAAHRFAHGHRIRVQVSSGVFPLYNRNLGTGEPMTTATRVITAAQAVHHTTEHASFVTLPLRAV